MSLLIDPARRTIVMTADQVRGLLGGRDFLSNLAHLSEIGCVAVCRVCLAAGGSGAVTASSDPIHPRFFVMCAHRSGQVSAKTPLDLTKLLDALCWTIQCSACQARVVGDNDPAASRYTITCPCTIREFRFPVALPVAQAATGAVESPALGSVGG
jgi:hypothetical protein